MSDVDKSFLNKFSDLDNQALEIGIGGKSSPETDENLYK